MILRTGVLYDGTLEAPRRNVDLFISDGRVAGITDARDGIEPDRSAACIVPGLVNAHVHLEMSGEANTMASFATLTPTQRAVRAAANARDTLRAGVTTVRDLGSSHGIAPEIRSAIDEGRIEGPRVRAAGAALCMTGGHGWFISRQVDGPWDARKAVREQLAAGADCIKLIATGGVLTKGAVPGNAQFTAEELHAAIDEAHSHGVRCAAHAIGTRGMLNALQAGVDSVEHGYAIDDTVLELFLRHGTYLVPTITAPQCILEHAHDAGTPGWAAEKAAAVVEGLAERLSRAYRAGVRIAGGSDAGTPFNHHAAYALEVEAMERVIGMSRHQALHAATAVAAELIGLTRGTLEVGEYADLLLLDADVAADSRPLRAPAAVMKEGRFV